MKTKIEHEECAEFDEDYEVRTCRICGRQKGWRAEYNHPTDRLIISCVNCGASYDMNPKWKRIAGRATDEGK